MNKNPLKLPPRMPDKKCNARTPNGYCKNRAGFRTPHFGEGRCWIHGGLTPAGPRRTLEGENAYNAQTIYTKMLPTSLAEELIEIKHDPLFSTLFNEYALLKMIVQSLLNNLPIDLSRIYGRPICETCKKEYDPSGEKFYVKYDSKWGGDQKRLDKLISTIESMSRVFEKISKHEERQQKYILISELEQLMLRWGKILMKHLGNDSRVSAIQDEIMALGFLRRPGEGDMEKLTMFRGIQTKIRNEYQKEREKDKDNVSIAAVIKQVYPELISDKVEEAKVIANVINKPRRYSRVGIESPFDAKAFLKKNVKTKKKNGRRKTNGK